MLKSYSFYFKLANFLILFHALGHTFGHFTTFADYSGASAELTAVYESMQTGLTPGGNNIWNLFLMFSITYSLFQLMVGVINLLLVYSKDISRATMKRLTMVNTILWALCLIVIYTSAPVNITLYSEVVFLALNLVALILIWNNTDTST